MNARPTMAIAELVSTLETSPRLARPMKMTPSTASRMGAMFLAKKETTPWVLMPVGVAAASVPCWNAAKACVASSVAIIDKPPRARVGGTGHAAVVKPYGDAHMVLLPAHRVE